MLINGVKAHNSILNRRKTNSLEKQKYEYFYPNNQINNKTIEECSKDLYKPRIIKNKRHNEYNNINVKDESNNYVNKKQQNENKVNNIDRANSIENLNQINNNNDYRNVIPRIVRNKKDINKYINSKQNNNREKENLNNNIYNKTKRPNSIDNNNINKNSLYNNEFKGNNKKMNRNSSYDNNLNNENLTLCKNCFDRKMLEEEIPTNQEIDKIEYLNNKFINENPFYFIDKMSDNEKKRINEKIESNSNKQRLAFANYKKAIDSPKSNIKEKLQLINEYSINPLSIEVGKDPRYLKQKKNYDHKEKIIHQNPDKYKGLEPRKAYNDYYDKCIYQIPKTEEMYYINPVYKENYIKALKKQIEDKRNKENENKKKQRMAEALANKKFNEYKKKANLNEKEKHNNGIEILKNDNKQLDEFKLYKKNVLKAREKKLENELEEKNNKIERDIKLRNKNEKSDNIGTFQDWLEDIDKKRLNKKIIKDEENKRWNNYIQNYNLKCKHCLVGNCDFCNRPYQKEKLKEFPPSDSSRIDFGVN